MSVYLRSGQWRVTRALLELPAQSRALDPGSGMGHTVVCHSNFLVGKPERRKNNFVDLSVDGGKILK